jgi:hypothetical protein
MSGPGEIKRTGAPAADIKPADDPASSPPDLPHSVDTFIRAEDGNPNHFYLGKGEAQGWNRMLKVHKSLRSWLSGAMIYVETTLDFLNRLTAEDITPELQKKLPLVSAMIEEIIQDLKSPYIDNGSLSLLALERIQNLLFRDSRASMLRLNINMTDANKVDTSSNLGTAYKHAVLEWLQKEFGERHISLNPEGSSFLAINASRHEISCSLGRFDREIRYRLRRPEMYERYEFDPALLDHFTPSATGMFLTMGTEGFEVDEVIESEDAEAVLELQKRMIGQIEVSLRLLAVGSTLAEKDPASIGLISGLGVYDAKDLPLVPGKPGYEMLKEKLELGTGYVPPSVYRSQFIRGTPTMDEEFMIHPRYGHDFGHLDHPERKDTPGGKDDTPGGALQLLEKAILTLSMANGGEEAEFALEELKNATRKFSLALDLGRIARSNPRNPAFVKWIQEVKLSDGTRLQDPYFIERVSLRHEDKVHLVTMEIDSFKAFSDRYPVDEEDSHFWGVFDPVFEEARERGIDQPLITQIAGDLVALAVPVVDSEGNPVDIGEYVSAVQQRVKEKFEGMPFQDRAKVKIKNGKGYRIERLPMWQKGNMVTSQATQPKDTEPFLTTLTVTAIAITAATPRTMDDKKVWEDNIAMMASRIETLKEEKRPHKGGYAFHEFDETKEREDARTSFSGIYRMGKIKDHDLISERFEVSIDSQLTEAWGEEWTGMDSKAKIEFVGILRERSAESPAILMPDDVVDAISTMSGAEIMQFPPAPILFMPLTAGALV